MKGGFGFFSTRKINQTVARFRHINENVPHVHHDALEFADGRIVLLTQLKQGQVAQVLQLPADPHVEKSAPVAAISQSVLV